MRIKTAQLSKSWLFVAVFAMMHLFSFGQNTITVSGIVTGANGVPLEGAFVTEVGAPSNGAATSADGSYSLTVEEGASIIVEFIGYTSQTHRVTGGTLNVQLVPGESEMDEVVVVGYASQRKVNLTGAVTSIDAKVLEDRPMSRLSQGLQGAVANLNIMTQYGGGAPNATQSFNIRGYTGLGSSGSPLIVIDGVQGGDINALNPNDIENISVVKDAAAAAIYGSSAPYGVIIITTKKGRAGKPTITYNNTFTVNTPMGMPDMLNSVDFARVYNEAGINAGRGEYGYFSAESIQRMIDFQNGVITTETEKSPNADRWNGWFAGNANNDWFDIYYKDAQVVQQHTVGISGGSDRTKYYLGLGYNDRPGMLRYGRDIYRRYNVRANLSNKFTDWLEMNFRTSYSKETFDGPWAGGSRTGGNWMHQIARKHPNVPLYIDLADGRRLFSEISDVPLMDEGGRQLESWDKPLITGELVLTPLKGWNATLNYTYEMNIWNNSNHKKTVYVPFPSGELGPIDWTYPNEFSRNVGFDNHTILNAFTSYNFEVGGAHEFTILGGYVRELWDQDRMSAANTNLYTDNVPALSTTFGPTPRISDARNQLATEGYFGRLNYNYNNKYLLEVVGRYDGTSRFTADSRWAMNPGASVGWNVHLEPWWDAISLNNLLNTLKFRYSYGSQGDQSQTGWYQFFPSLGTSAPTSSNWYFQSGREARTSAPGLVNPALTWITTTVSNFGIDLTAFSNKLSVTAEIYKRSAKDFLGPARNLPAILGTNPPQENIAAIENKGFELTLNWRDRVGEVGYSLRGVLGNYNAWVTRYPNEARLITNWYEGEKMGSIYGYTTEGFFTGDADVAKHADQSKLYSRWGAGDIKYADLNGDGVIDWGDNTVDNMGDRSIIGNSTPQYTYSLFGDVTWNNFDFSFFLQGVGKRDIFFGSGTNYFWGITGSEWQSSPFTVHMDRWTPTNPNGYFPKFYMSGENGKNMNTQTKYMQNGAYFRLKNVQLGYTIPTSVFQGIGIQKLRVFALVENVFTISPLQRHSTIDPEIAISDMKIYPMQRGYSMGVNLTL